MKMVSRNFYMSRSCDTPITETIKRSKRLSIKLSVARAIETLSLTIKAQKITFQFTKNVHQKEILIIHP